MAFGTKSATRPMNVTASGTIQREEDAMRPWMGASTSAGRYGITPSLSGSVLGSSIFGSEDRRWREFFDLRSRKIEEPPHLRYSEPKDRRNPIVRSCAVHARGMA